MRPIMTVVGTLLLAGNLVLAMPVRQTVTVVRSGEQADREIRSEMARLLTERGIDSAAAQQILNAHYATESGRLAFELFQLQTFFPEIGRHRLLGYIAERALHGETFSLRSYDHILGMLQRLHSPQLTSSLQTRAMHCSLLNRA